MNEQSTILGFGGSVEEAVRHCACLGIVLYSCIQQAGSGPEDMPVSPRRVSGYKFAGDDNIVMHGAQIISGTQVCSTSHIP